METFGLAAGTDSPPTFDVRLSDGRPAAPAIEDEDGLAALGTLGELGCSTSRDLGWAGTTGAADGGGESSIMVRSIHGDCRGGTDMVGSLMVLVYPPR